MRGMDRLTGKALDGAGHLRQSISDILWTPIGSRVARREYGSLIPDLIDQPMNAAGKIRLFAAAALALSRWEKRLKLSKLSLVGSAGAYTLQLEGTRTDVSTANARTVLTVPLHPDGTLTAFA